VESQEFRGRKPLHDLSPSFLTAHPASHHPKSSTPSPPPTQGNAALPKKRAASFLGNVGFSTPSKRGASAWDPSSVFSSRPAPNVAPDHARGAGEGVGDEGVVLLLSEGDAAELQVCRHVIYIYKVCRDVIYRCVKM